MMPGFGMSLGGGHIHGHSVSSGAVQRAAQGQRMKLVALAAAAAGVSIGGLHLHRAGKLPQLPRRAGVGSSTAPLLQMQIPRELAEVMCGAIGEIVQVACLYPVDTIKVRCQVGGQSVKAVLQQLLAPGASPAGVLRQLYAGVVSASLASVAVGSLYFLTFCAAKRAATKMVAQHEQAAKPAAGAAAAVVGAAGAAAAGTAGGSAAHHYPHSQHSLGVDCHAHDPVFAAICSDDKASKTAAAAARQKQQQQQASATPKQQQQPAIVELSSGGKLQVNILAALSAACVGALIEAPVELFKHRAQAGQITGPMLGHVAAALKASGPAALYGSFFVPFLFKSLPFDIGELMTYSCLSDWRAAQVAAGGASKARAGSSSSSTVVAVAPPASAAAAVMSSSSEDEHHQQHVPALGSLTAAALGTAPGSSWLQPGQLVREMPDHAWDCLVGAAAGAAAVLISHPPDCIKTVMETGGGVTHGAHGLALNSAAAFAATGRRMVGQQGGRGLFVGLAPRLVESVPSTMLYWLAVEGCRRLLEPYVAPESPSTPAAASG